MSKKQINFLLLFLIKEIKIKAVLTLLNSKTFVYFFAYFIILLVGENN